MTYHLNLVGKRIGFVHRGNESMAHVRQFSVLQGPAELI